jgi:hypothetical protein
VLLAFTFFQESCEDRQLLGRKVGWNVCHRLRAKMVSWIHCFYLHMYIVYIWLAWALISCATYNEHNICLCVCVQKSQKICISCVYDPHRLRRLGHFPGLRVGRKDLKP